MKMSMQIKGFVISTVSYLYILLFTYAGVSKLLAFEDFGIKLGQSPLLSVFAGTMAWGVLITEFCIVMLLLFERSRFWGLFASYCLMVFFTTYIYLILNYSSFIPCSCGGILENMGWSEHLVFNIFFTLLAVAALLLFPDFYKNAPFKKILTLAAAGIFCMLFLIVLFLFSEDNIKKHNPFIRRFTDHAQPEVRKMDLGFNSYYFAGLANGNIYLGNSTAPIYVTVVDTGLRSKARAKITLNRTDFPFRSLQLQVAKKQFYLTDGMVPCVFTGTISDWKATYENRPIPFFSLAAVIDTTALVLRSTSLARRTNTLQTHTFIVHLKEPGNKFILPKQVDGIFDTDGQLLYNEVQKKIHYIYYYRNEYLTLDANTALLRTGKTIDTTNAAVLKIRPTADGAMTMGAPPVLINKSAAVYGNLLFIHSERLGRYEGKKMLQHASIVDVYDHVKGTYIGSMYIYNVGAARMSHFIVDEQNLYTLSGSFLTVVSLPPKIRNALTK